MESDNLKSISIRQYLYLCKADEEEDGMVALWYGNGNGHGNGNGNGR